MTVPAGYILVFEDNFDAPSLDLAKWWRTTSTPIPGQPSYSGYGQESWDPACVTVSGGQLRLIARADLHAGEVRSLASFRYGYYESLVKMPGGGPGFWGGPWLSSILGSTVEQSRQEIDIAENDSNATHRVGMNLHWGNRDNAPADNGGYTNPAVDYTSGFHTYGVLYAADRIDFYVDNAKVARSPHDYIQPSPPALFDPMQMRFSLSIFGPSQPYAAPPDATTVWPGVLLVDWVRVYAPVVVPPPTGGDTTPPVVALTVPTDPAGFVRRKATVTVTASVSDNVAVTRVDFLLNGEIRGTRTATPYALDWKVPAPPNVTYKWEAIATDAAGNNAGVTVIVKSR